MARKSSTRIKGTARRYIDPRTGAEISRRQYDKIKAGGRKVAAPNSAALKGARVTRKGGRYYQLVMDAVERERAQGKTVTRSSVRNSTDFKSVVRDLNAKPRKRKDGTVSDAEKARVNEIKLKALKALGRRDGIPDSVPVGETREYLTRMRKAA